MGMTRGAPQKLSGKALCENGESLGVSQLATSECPELEEATDGATPKTPEQLRLERYEKMLQRAGFAPATHLKHLQAFQKKEGADAMSLGVTSRRLYEEISGKTAFDEFFFEIPSKKSALEMMPDVARKILSKDSTADIERTKEKTEAEMIASGGMSKHQGFEEEARVRPEGPTMLTLPPQKDMLNSEGKQAILSERDMEGFVTYRFADGFTYKGTMHENRPCGEGTAQYANGGEYVGGWLNGKYQGYGRMTSPTGTVYEGDWHEGRRSGKGKLTYKSGSTYEGDFLLGVFHGRGRFESANANVVYEGRWNSGFVWDHGMLILADGTKVVRSWPTRSRFGGGLSLRSAVELIRSEQEMARLNKLDEDKELYQVANHMELQYRVKAIRQDIANRRAEKKANEKMESAEQRKAAKIAAMETQLQAVMNAEKEEEQDGIEKEFNA